MPPRGTVNVADTWASARSQWQALTPGNRRGIAAVAAAVVAGVLLAAALASRGPAMAPLFTNLAPPDGAAIVAQLEHSKVPYHLADNGQTILVPAAQVDRLRLQMAGQGLPKAGSVGLSSVLTLPFGATDFTRQVAYQNGLQGELEQTINQIHGVSASRVQIVLPQASTFSGQASPASAAVLVELQPGASLTPGQVGGIAQLVASSVQGLTPAGVTVLDQNGQILWTQGTGAAAAGTPAAGGAAGQAQSQLQVEQQFEQTLQTQLQQLLDQVFGSGNVVTQVQAQLSFDSGTTDQKMFSPKGSSPAIVSSLQQLQQTVVGAGGSGAVPGTATNSFPTYPAGTGTSNTSSTSNQLTQNFDVSQQDTHTVVAPGQVSRLSVAVVVNSQLSAAQQALVRSTVQAAVGADPARQDQITVVGLPFNHSLLSKLTSGAPQAKGTTLPLPVLAAIGLLLLLVLILLLTRRRGAEAPLDAAAGAGASIPPALSVSVVGEGDDGLAGALAGAQAARNRLHGSLRERPEDVARVIRVWLENAD